MKTPLIALAATLAATLAPVAAASAATQNSVTVEYRDLNLASPEGQAALDRRVSQAARKVCGFDAVRTGTRLAPLKDMDCYREAKAKAKQQVAATVAAQQLGG